MKTTRILIGACLGSVFFTAPAAAESVESGAKLPDLAAAEITIPYTELKSLWEAAQPAPGEGEEETAPPPVEAVVLAAEYELVLGDGKAEIDATYRVQSLAEGWQMIPLLGGDARLEEAETGEAGIVWKDDSYRLLTHGQGEFLVKLKFAVARPAEWLQGLRLLPGTATLNRLRVTGIPEGRAARIQGLAPTETGDGFAIYHLPGDARQITVSVEQYEKPQAPAEPEPPVPSAWDIQSEVFVRYWEGRLFYENRIYCQADEGSGMSMVLHLPHNALSVSVSGDDLGEGLLGRREDGMRPLQINWHSRDVLDRVIQLSYEVPQSPLAAEWVLHAPKVSGGGETRSLFAIAAVEGLELGGADLRDAVQSRRLPEWLRDRIGQSDFLTAESGATYPLTATWLPRLETAQAMVSEAAYETRLVADGALLVHAAYTIQHQSPISWRLELPAMDEILTCEINDEASQPVKRGDDQIEFSLVTPGKGETRVAFCYAAKQEAMDPVSGRLELELPRTELFVHELKWLLRMPDSYEVEIQGNVAIDRGAPSGPEGAKEAENVIHLKKELVRGEHPAVEIHYRRRGLDD